MTKGEANYGVELVVAILPTHIFLGQILLWDMTLHFLSKENFLHHFSMEVFEQSVLAIVDALRRSNSRELQETPFQEFYGGER